MATGSINFTAGQASGLEALGGATQLMANVLHDATGSVRSRPGLEPWDDYPVAPVASPILGMQQFGTNLVYVTADRRVWAWQAPGLVMPLSNLAQPLTMMDGNLRPSFVTTASKCVVVNGGYPQKWVGVGLSGRLGLVGAPPPRSTDVASLATRIVVSNAGTSGDFQWSLPLDRFGGDAGHEVWDPLNYMTTSARPDPILAMWDNTNELYCFGSETLQVFVPDADMNNVNVGFSPTRTMNLGLIAAASVIRVDDQFMMLDRERRFILTDGRSYVDKSTQYIGKVLRGLTRVDDCWGFRLKTEQWDACVWFFPTVKMGFIWDRLQDKWSEWRQDPANPFITSAYMWPEYNLMLAGMSDGTIAKLTASTTTDLGKPIKIELISGYSDRDSMMQKHCKLVFFKFRRTPSVQGTVPQNVRFWMRTDNANWHQIGEVNLLPTTDIEPTHIFRSLGTYRQMQWKLEYTGSAVFSLVSCQEEYDLLGA